MKLTEWIRQHTVKEGLAEVLKRDLPIKTKNKLMSYVLANATNGKSAPKKEKENNLYEYAKEIFTDSN